jgi:hypothetical protein
MGFGAARDGEAATHGEGFDCGVKRASHGAALPQGERVGNRLCAATKAGHVPKMDEDDSVELDAVATVSRITALEMLVRQIMIVQLRILDKMGEISLTGDYVKTIAQAYTEKIDESPIIESTSPEVNYEFKMMVLHNLERFFDDLERHVRDNPA